MNKRVIYFWIFLFSIFFVTSALVNTSISKWEPSNAISTSEGNLQEVISGDILRTTDKNSVLDFPALNPGHNLSEVWVSVNGNEMTFKNAIQNTDLCGRTNPKTTYSNPLDPGHLGTEIEISIGKSLQDAINDGTLVGKWSDWSSCVNDSQTRTCFCGTDGSSVCPGSDTEFCGNYLINNNHTENDCTSAGGSVYFIFENPACAPGTSCPLSLTPTGSFCQFSKSSCPSDWTEYEHHYAAKTCDGRTITGPFCESHNPCEGTSCTTVSKWDSSNSPPTCAYEDATYREFGDCNWNCGTISQTCTSYIDAVRCY
jgi:hypothetical protein